VPAVITGGWLADPAPAAGLPPDVGAILATATFSADPSSHRYVEIRHAGAAVAEGAARPSSSMGNRDRQFHLQLVGLPSSPNAADDVRHRLDATKVALGDLLTARTYLNGLDGTARSEAAATSIDVADLAVIARLSKDLDPHDVLRFGVNHRR
jgi:hypothetical protein